MKTVTLLITSFVALTSLNAMASSDTTACGTVSVERIMCVTTPCPYGLFKLKTRSGFKFNLVSTSESIEQQMIAASKYPTKIYCAQGQLKNRSSISVTALEPQAKADH